MTAMIFNITIALLGTYLVLMWIKAYVIEKALAVRTYKQLRNKNINTSELNKLIKSCRMQTIVYVEATIVGCLLAILGCNNWEVIMKSNVLRILFILTSIVTLSVCIIKLSKERSEIRLVKRKLRSNIIKLEGINRSIHFNTNVSRG